MKEAYVKAEMEIIAFESEDVIRTSGMNETDIVPFDEEEEGV